MEDTISRKMAIDAHYEYCNKHPNAGFPVWSLKILENLPSAQPERMSVNLRVEKLSKHQSDFSDLDAQPDSKELSSTHKALDTISRQAAMEEISKQQTYKMFEGEDTLYLDANDVGSVLASLPSAQPETHEECTETHGVCLDTIDGHATLDWLKNEWNGMVTSLFDGIKALPSAQRTGRWMDDGSELGCACSECGASLDEYISNLNEYNHLIKYPRFCLNCGSYNGGGAWLKSSN